jgi:hypothetical protein
MVAVVQIRSCVGFLASIWWLNSITQPVHGFSTTSSKIERTSSVSLNRAFRLQSASIDTYSTSQSVDDTEVSKDARKRCIGTIAFLLPSGDDAINKKSKFGIHSPVERPSYLQAAKHLASKATWFSEDEVTTTIVTVPKDGDDATNVRFTLENADILIALGLSTKADLEFAQSVFQQRKQQSREERFSKCQFALDCENTSGVEMPTIVGPYDKETASTNPSLLFPWTDASSGQRFDEQMEGLFNRWTSDDFTVALMLFLNRFSGFPVNWVKDSADATWEKGPVRNAQEFYQMGESV